MFEDEPEEVERDAITEYEEIDDVEVLAQTLHQSGLVPHSDQRTEALFRRAASGKGYFSQLLGAAGVI